MFGIPQTRAKRLTAAPHIFRTFDEELASLAKRDIGDVLVHGAAGNADQDIASH
ncbi:MAG: hypothetical protein J0J15_25720 [Mesorhizobium sp.]|nr:hypothetical protein [Mesorhizobium sp.]